ncbi:phosphatidylglycerol lysyltransferase domain-containing protein [Actinoplanes sp. NPDC051475]|uniref:phosphatidylglycerol lysyltransferase domain-containing protein n=1 Tax=Actinoplanes sp. NPDC051475 TaxID=3157225 RepID=UPI00344C8077
MTLPSSVTARDAVQPWRARPPLSRAAIARWVQVAGLFDVVTAVVPPRHGRLVAVAEFLPMAGVLSAGAATAAAGLLLVYLGAGLRRGKRRAWQVAVALAALGVVLHLAKGLDVDAALVSAALLVLLVVTRGRFGAVADPRNRWRAPAAFAGFAVAGFVCGFVEIAVREDRLVGRPGWWGWAQEAAFGLVGVSGPIRFVHPIAAEAVSVTTGGFGLLAAGVAVVLLLRPGSPLPQRSEAEDALVRDLLERCGGQDSLGYFALRRDKALIWAPSRRAVVAYRVVNGVSLASGDPVGVQSAWPDAIEEWLRDCARHGWTPAVLGCGQAGGRAYRRAGLDVVELGDEAILNVGTFSLQGRPMRGVRQAVARIERAGYTCEVARRRDLSAAACAELVRVADALRDGSVERGFSMALSRLGDAADGDCLFVVGRDSAGRIRAILHLVPWGDDGLSLDLMRGDRRADNGLTEFLVVSTVRAAPALGVRRISLNFAVLRSVFARAEQLGAGPVLRLWHRLLRLASHVWQIESLYRANAKFLPAWQPRYLCFPKARDLPRVTVAVLSAEAFLPIGGVRRGLTGSDR